MADDPIMPKEYGGPIIFERGYRPFFPAAAIFAGLAIPLWIILINTGTEIPTGFSARDYHVHEMIFGYLGAVFAGFIFTALPNWTGRPAVDGGKLAFLLTLWICGRIAIFTSQSWPVGAAVVDASFLVVIAGIIWREVLVSGNVRNSPICLMIST